MGGGYEWEDDDVMFGRRAVAFVGYDNGDGWFLAEQGVTGATTRVHRCDSREGARRQAESMFPGLSD